MKKGIFVTFEGGEGSGKSSQAKLFAERLERQGITTWLTKEPGGTVVGEGIREYFLNPGRLIKPEVELALMIADRALHIDEINPALLEGTTVVCDRFADSTWAYQGWARELPLDFVERFNEAVMNGLMPDVTYYLKVPPEIGLMRVQNKKGIDSRLDDETLEFHAKLAEGFDQLAVMYPKRIIAIDATKSFDVVAEWIWCDYKRRFLQEGE